MNLERKASSLFIEANRDVEKVEQEARVAMLRLIEGFFGRKDDLGEAPGVAPLEPRSLLGSKDVRKERRRKRLGAFEIESQAVPGEGDGCHHQLIGVADAAPGARRPYRRAIGAPRDGLDRSPELGEERPSEASTERELTTPLLDG